MVTTLQISVYGRVQGVWFRASTREQALKLGLGGFVKNVPDGSVFITVTGERSAIEEFVAWCRVGPQMARVDNVRIEEVDETSFEDFEVRR